MGERRRRQGKVREWDSEDGEAACPGCLIRRVLFQKLIKSCKERNRAHKQPIKLGIQITE